MNTIHGSLLHPVMVKAFDRYLEGLMDGDSRICLPVLKELVAEGVPLTAIYVDVIGRAMEKIGELWEKRCISVAVEHLATSTTLFTLAQFFPLLTPQKENGRLALVSCAPFELHELGAYIVSDFLQLQGWKTLLLGANTPKNDLLDLVDKRKPDLLCLSITMSEHLPAFEETLAALGTQQPDLPVWIGGQALAGNGRGQDFRLQLLAHYPAVRYGADLKEFEKSLNAVTGGETVLSTSCRRCNPPVSAPPAPAAGRQRASR